MWASGPAAAARPVEAGLGPARDGWPPTSALALLVKMAAVAIAATKVQSLSQEVRHEYPHEHQQPDLYREASPSILPSPPQSDN